jgi:hypothetical protein
MACHHVDAPLLRMLERLEDWSIQWLTDAEHEPLACVDHGTKAGNEFSVTVGLFRHEVGCWDEARSITKCTFMNCYRISGRIDLFKWNGYIWG